MHPANPHAVSRSWHAALYVFLVYVFVTGGSSQVRDWTDAIAREPVRIEDGCWPIADRPCTGLDWDPEKVARYRIS